MSKKIVSKNKAWLAGGLAGKKSHFLHMGNCVSNIQHFLVRKAAGATGSGAAGYHRTPADTSLMDPAACPAAAAAAAADCCCCCCEDSCAGTACCVEDCDKMDSSSSGRRVLLVSSADNDNVLILNQKQ